MSEQRLLSGMTKDVTREAIPHAALCVMYVVKPFLALAKQAESDE